MSIRNHIFSLLAYATAALTFKAHAELPKLITGIEINCTEEGQRLQDYWTGNCTLPRMDVNLFLIMHTLEYPGTRDLAEIRSKNP